MWRLKRRISHDGLASIISVSQRLNHLISAALTQVGEEDEDGKLTKQVIEKLNELYIKTPDQLRQALDTPEVLEQVMNTALRGMLLPAVRDELKHDEHAALWGKARPKLSAKAADAWKPPKPLKRSLEIARADINQLSAIDQLSQTFRARLFLILRIPDGALDEHLIRECDATPHTAVHTLAWPRLTSGTCSSTALCTHCQPCAVRAADTTASQWTRAAAPPSGRRRAGALPLALAFIFLVFVHDTSRHVAPLAWLAGTSTRSTSQTAATSTRSSPRSRRQATTFSSSSVLRVNSS